MNQVLVKISASGIPAVWRRILLSLFFFLGIAILALFGALGIIPLFGYLMGIAKGLRMGIRCYANGDNLLPAISSSIVTSFLNSRGQDQPFMPESLTMLCRLPAAPWPLLAFQHGHFLDSIPRQVRAVPPAAAKGLKQCGGVRVTIRLSLNLAEQGLLIGLFSAQEREIVSIAGVKLFLRQIERYSSGLGGGGRGLQTVGVLLDRVQGISHILKGSQHSAAVLFVGLSVRRSRGPFPVKQSLAIKNRLCNASSYIPKAS